MWCGQALVNQPRPSLPSSQVAYWHQGAWTTQTSYTGFMITSDLNSEDDIKVPARRYPYSRHIVSPLDSLSQAVIANLSPTHIKASR